MLFSFYKSCLRSLVLIAGLLSLTRVQATCIVHDDAGNVLHLQTVPHRVISLSPDLTEMFFALKADKALVGVIAESDYPSNARTLPRVGTYMGVDEERILSLHPDLIVSWGNNFSSSLATFKQLGIPRYIADPHTFSDMIRELKNLGCLMGASTQANAMANQWQQSLATLKQRYASQKPVAVFYQIGDEHTLFTINKTSWINDAITLCGGRNIFADAVFPAPAVSVESVMMLHPAVIFADAQSDEWKNQWREWQQIPAVRNHLLFTLNPDYIERAGPRLIEGVAQLCQAMQYARSKFS